VGHSSESGEQTVSPDPKAVPRLELRNITKAYPAVVANDNISLSILPGQIHAVLGENGAGKSTLMKIIYGVVKPDQQPGCSPTIGHWHGVPALFLV
jgi:simple sugar transport system ATP-binding protein